MEREAALRALVTEYLARVRELQGQGKDATGTWDREFAARAEALPEDES